MARKIRPVLEEMLAAIEEIEPKGPMVGNAAKSERR